MRRLVGLLGALALGVAALVALSVVPAGAALIDVDDASDPAVGVPGDCTDGTPGNCSLRDAFALASSTAADDTITVQAGLGTVSLLNGSLDITGGAFDLTVIGNGVVIDASGNAGGLSIIRSTAFSLTLQDLRLTGNTTSAAGGGAVSANQQLVLTNVQIDDNHAVGGSGGAAEVGESLIVTDSLIFGNDADINGGAFEVGGSITIFGTTITDNHAPTTGAFGSGGAINVGAVGAIVSIIDSTISNNSSGNTGGGVNIGGSDSSVTVLGSTISGNTTGDFGGGILIGGANTALQITNSTITGNTVTDAMGFGGGVDYGGGGGSVDVVYSTVVANTAAGGANFFFGGAGTLTAFGTIVGNPLGGGGNCSQFFTSNGYNFEQATGSCGFNAPTDTANGADPELGALADNGGPTPTLLPAETSPVVDRIPASSPCAGVNVVVDQRGEPRPTTLGEFCDIGSVELQPAPPVTTTTTTTTTTTPAGPTPGPADVVVATPTFTG